MTSKLLKELLNNYDLEEVFLILEVDPYDALLKLYEIGEVDLERLEEYLDDSESEDE
ncbi:MAG: hypothetical protein IM337_07605 [Microcystis sp. M110S1]|uniref:hypothetical protein n=1 Tax=Microcystis sp. M110S1 TaxID=2771102 RepID=UPI00258341DF|nr:hypothetical protein [Microcystis sp. M110S1]MCA2973867.1 hypothetical protein [Microcystis sp. M110S1]